MRRVSYWLLLFVVLSGCLRGSGDLTPNNDGNNAPNNGTANNGNLDAGNNGNNGAGDAANNGAPDVANNGTVTPSDMGPSDLGPGDLGPADVGPSDMNSPDVPLPVDMPDPVDMPPDVPFVPGTCGNMVVELGETCDPCNLDCDDGNACTVDEPGGDPATCLGFCWNRPLFDCIDADGCCPAGCDSTTDSDCSTTCGDGVLDAGETCDPIDTCPTTCDDMDPSTRDVLTGSPDNCNVACSYVPIRVCADGDGYCPAGCALAQDDDCAASCGNGLVEQGETCDPPSSCPACDDGNPCTTNVTNGSAATCDVTCSYPLITTCTGGDGCCADGCTAANDNDCSPTCGDRVLDPLETCDGPPECNGITCNQGGACTTAARTGGRSECNVHCGYPEIVGCFDNDGCCSPGCHAGNDNDCNAACGNTVIEPGEVCDPPETCVTSCLDDGDVCTATEFLGDPTTCDARCANTPITTCGDPEGCCAPGCNANNDPDCDPICGNNVVEMGEICDGNCPVCDDMDGCTVDSQTGDPATCDVVCQNVAITQCIDGDGCCAPGCNANNDTDCAAICGNMILEPGETCDGTCPANCSDGVACTSDVQSGSAATCDITCSNPVITQCINADGCCPSACTNLNDTDCP